MYESPSYLKTPPNGVVRKGAIARPLAISSGAVNAFAPPVRSNFHHNPAYGGVSAGLAVGAGMAGLVGLVLLPSLLLYPWIIKQFKPKWGYGKRVAAGLAIGYGTTLVKDVLTPAEVKLAREEARAARFQRAAEQLGQ